MRYGATHIQPGRRPRRIGRNSTTQRSDHTQRPRLFGTVAEPPLLCQEAGRIAWMSAIRI
jgi:hypothetical protein